MEFTTQAELLEHLGKNPNDRSLVQRMIARGEVVKEWGVYVIVDKDIIIRELKEEIKELKKSDTKFVSKAMWEKVLAHGEINNLKMENADLKDHLKFFYEMDLARKEAMENVVKAYYDKNPNDWWENAVEKANKFMGFSENPCENDEIEYVKGIL